MRDFIRNIFQFGCSSMLTFWDSTFHLCVMSDAMLCVVETLLWGDGEVRQIPTTGRFRRQACTCQAPAGRHRGETQLSRDCKQWTRRHTEPTWSMHGKAQIPLRRLPRNFPGLKGTSRVCRRLVHWGRHGEVGIVEFGLNHCTSSHRNSASHWNAVNVFVS